jgi:copper(I)-binding protein
MTRIALILVAILALLPVAIEAHEYDLGPIHIDHPWARATPNGAKIGGGYMTITNKGTTADRLTGASTPVASRVVLHQMTMDGGVMKMRPLDNGIEIKPGETVELNTESMHLMFEGLKEPLKEGQRIKGTLNFEKAGSIEVEYVVEGMGAKSPSMSSMPPVTMHDH